MSAHTPGPWLVHYERDAFDSAQSTNTHLYNALACLVLVVRQVRQDIANPLSTKYNLEDLELALKKSEALLLKTNLPKK